MELNVSTIAKWIPYKLLEQGDETVCEWLYTGDEQFKEGFFDSTLRKCRWLPQNAGLQKNTTSLYKITEWASQISVQEPSVFVFHVSRCGSTIVSQAFANYNNSIVLSEVPFFDDVLQAGVKKGNSYNGLLKDVVKLYSQPKTTGHSPVFIKTDSWHIMLHSQLRQLYPNVPFILLYRNPAEVVRSLGKTPGRQCIPQFISPSFFGITGEVITAEDFYNYPAKVIEKYLEAYIDVMQKDNNAFLFNYKDGMAQVVAGIYKVIGLPFTEDDREKMQEQLQYHSKLPGMPFSKEPEVENIDNRLSRLFTLYNLLEDIRLSAKQ